MGVIDFPGGAVHGNGYNTSWYGRTNGVYSLGLSLPNGRTAPNGSRPILLTGVRSYWAGRGRTSSLRIEVGPYSTNFYAVGPSSHAQETGWLPISGLFGSATTTHVAIRNAGTEAFYFARAGSGGGGTFTGDTGQQAWAGALSGQVAFAEIPSPPGTPNVETLAPTQIRVTWTQPITDGGAAISGWRVQLAENSGFTVGVRNVDMAGHGVISNIDPGKTYYIRVAAKNAVSNAAGTLGQWSGVRSFATAAPPTAPQSLTVVDVTQVSGKAQWGEPSWDGGTPVTTYEGQVAENAAYSQGLRTFSQPKASGTSRALSNLAPDTSYWVRVRAVNAAGPSPWVETQFRTEEGAEVLEGGSWHKHVVEVFDDGWDPVSPEFFTGSVWIK